MTKLAALLAALVVTALCAAVAIYAMPLLLHWQAEVALSLLFYAVIILIARRKKRLAAAREAEKDKPLTYVIRRPLREP
jgi:hypothetical protein